LNPAARALAVASILHAAASGSAFDEPGDIPSSSEAPSGLVSGREDLREGSFFPSFSRADFHGSLWSRYRIRATADETDQDFSQDLSLELGDPARHRVTFAFLGEWSLDLDGVDGSSALSQIEDTFDSPANGRLLRAHADVHRLGSVERVRLGRQEHALLPEVPLFDGIDAASSPLSPWKVRLRAFGGVPSHLYESSPSGDSLYGAGIEAEPCEGTWAALTYAHIEDDPLLTDERDDFLVFDARQRVLRPLTVSGRLTALEGELRDLLLRAFAADAESGWSGQVSYFALLRTERRRVTEIDPFYEVLLEERPYHDARVLVTKDLGGQFSLTGEIAIRELENEGDEGTFNREFRRYSIGPDVHDWPLDGLSLSLTAEAWESDEKRVRTLGAAAAQEIGEDLRIEVGTEYSLFKFDPALGDEREDVRSVYVRGGYDVDESLTADVRLEIDDDDRDTYRTLRVGLLWRF